MSVNDPLKLIASVELDLVIDQVVLGEVSSKGIPTSPWSRDYNAAHSLYDTLAKKRDWAMGYNLTNRPRGVIVLGPDGGLVANAPTAILAMVRAVLSHYLTQHTNGKVKKEKP